MADQELYITKCNPSVDDWIKYNMGLFAGLRGEVSDEPVRQYAYLVDLQRHAAAEEVPIHEYFEQLQTRVGGLGEYALELVYSEMDAASHVGLAPTGKKYGSI